MNSPQSNNCRLDNAMSWLALVYLVALFLAIPLRDQLLAADLVAPLMIWQLWRKREELLEVLLDEGKWLMLAFAWMCLAVATQFVRGTGSLYDFAVFGYMAVIYCFYRVAPVPSRKTCAVTGAALLGLCFLGWAAVKLVPDAPFISRMLRPSSNSFPVKTMPFSISMIPDIPFSFRGVLFQSTPRSSVAGMQGLTISAQCSICSLVGA